MIRFWTATNQNGQPYYGLTSNGSYPAQVCLTSVWLICLWNCSSWFWFILSIQIAEIQGNFEKNKSSIWYYNVHNRPDLLYSRSWVWWTTKTFQLVCSSFRGSFCHGMARLPLILTTTPSALVCLFLAMGGARQVSPSTCCRLLWILPLGFVCSISLSTRFTFFHHLEAPSCLS